MSGTMKAVIAAQPGGPDVLTLVDRPVPAPSDGEVLIRVAAAGINRPDIMQRSGALPAPAGVSDVLGLEAAGRSSPSARMSIPPSSARRSWRC